MSQNGSRRLRLFYSNIDCPSDMQLPTAPGPRVELQTAMQSLDISSRPHEQPQHPIQPQGPQPPLPQRVTRETSRATSDHHHHHEDQARSPQSAAKGQPGGARKASKENVWYLKSIDFTSPSGITRTYNVITQNYNGYAFPPY